MTSRDLRKLVEQYETPEETRRNDEKETIARASHDSTDLARIRAASSRRRQENTEQLRRDVQQRVTAELAATIGDELRAEPEVTEPVGPDIAEQTAHAYARMTGQTGPSKLPPEAVAALARMNNTL